MNNNRLFIAALALLMLVAGCTTKPPEPTPVPTATQTPATPAPEGTATAPDATQAPQEADEDEQEYAPAPDFTLTDLDGNSHSLSDYRGEIVILNFWASWCKPCEYEMPDFDLMNQELLENNKARLLTINMTDGVEETEDSARAFIMDNNYSMTVLLDTDGDAANAYQVYNIPTTVIIDQEGRVAGYQPGALTKEDVLKYIEGMS